MMYWNSRQSTKSAINASNNFMNLACKFLICANTSQMKCKFQKQIQENDSYAVNCKRKLLEMAIDKHVQFFRRKRNMIICIGMMCYSESKVKLNTQRQESPERERELPNQTKRWHVGETQNTVIRPDQMLLGNMDKGLVDYHIQDYKCQAKS